MTLAITAKTLAIYTKTLELTLAISARTSAITLAISARTSAIRLAVSLGGVSGRSTRNWQLGN